MHRLRVAVLYPALTLRQTRRSRLRCVPGIPGRPGFIDPIGQRPIDGSVQALVGPKPGVERMCSMLDDRAS